MTGLRSSFTKKGDVPDFSLAIPGSHLLNGSKHQRTLPELPKPEEHMSRAAVALFLDQFPQAFSEGDPNAGQKVEEAANVRTLQGMYRGITAGDFQVFTDALTDDAELEIVSGPGMPFNGRWKGREVVSKAVRENFAQIEESRPVIESIVAQGDTVVLCCREQGRYQATKQPYDVYWILTVKYYNGKIVRAHEICASVVES
jgi:ketosteroid isomerase-like protein